MAWSNVMLQFNDDSVCISAITLQTAVGVNCAQTVAAINADVAGFFDFPNYFPIARDPNDEDPEVLAGAFCNYIDLDLPGKSRLYELIKRPLFDIVEQAKLSRADMGKTALWFALPEVDPAINALKLGEDFLDECIRHMVLPTFLDVSGIQSGATGIYKLIENAKQFLLESKVQHVLIVSPDSYFIDNRLAHYDDLWRLKTDRNPFGFIAGEAGTVILLEKVKAAKQRKIKPILGIGNIGTGLEENSIKGDKSSTGAGLTQAIEALNLDQNSTSPVNWVISDLNGESYPAYEWGLINVRLNSLFDDDLTLNHFADTVGEVGAATAGIQLACAAQAFSEESGPSDHAVIYSGNEAGMRSAIHVGAIVE